MVAEGVAAWLSIECPILILMRRFSTALCVVFLLVVGGVFSAGSATAATPPRVAVWGDSLAYQMCGENQQAGPGREFGFTDVGCSGYSGVTSGGMWRSVVEPGWRDPVIPWGPSQRFGVRDSWRSADVIVVSAGTNNALRQEPPQYLGWDIDNVMREAAGRRVVWFDLGVRTDVPQPLFNGAQFVSAVRHNDVLWGKARQYPNLRVVAWGGQTGPNPGYLKSDGVHLTAAGWAARWRLAQVAIRS